MKGNNQSTPRGEPEDWVLGHVMMKAVFQEGDWSDHEHNGQEPSEKAISFSSLTCDDKSLTSNSQRSRNEGMGEI